MQYHLYQAPIGEVLFTANAGLVTAMHWTVFKDAPKPRVDWTQTKEPFLGIVQQLEEYFAGERTAFDIPYELQGTAFQKAVWREIEAIPYGKFTSYSEIAHRIGKPKAVRAVGTAVGHNPLSIVVPCHRVLTATHRLGGYAGGIPAKEFLLNRESITYKR